MHVVQLCSDTAVGRNVMHYVDAARANGDAVQ
jgi:hypothetical protein